jgi:hypothetical protein
MEIQIELCSTHKLNLEFRFPIICVHNKMGHIRIGLYEAGQSTRSFHLGRQLTF